MLVKVTFLKFLKYTFVALFLCICINRGEARNFDIQFENISIQDGLSHNNVNCIFQDSRGFLWIGTKEGLNRYDGYNILTYYAQQDDTSSLSDNFINAICEDPNGRGIWIGTRKGLTFFDFKQEKFTRYLTDNVYTEKSTQGMNVSSLVPYGDGGIWIGSNIGLLKLIQKESDTWPLIYSPEVEIQPYGTKGVPAKILPARLISCLYPGKDGTLWIGYTSGEFFSLTGEGIEEKITYFKEFPGGVIKGLVEDEFEQLWIATDRNGIVKMDRDKQGITTFTKEKFPGLESNSYNAICRGDRGKIWLGTKNNGLVEGTIGDQILGEESSQILKVEYYKNNPGAYNSIIENTIRCVYMDRTGVLWAGTRGNGIEKVMFQPNYFNNYNATYSNRFKSFFKKINSIVEDSQGHLWIGTQNGLSSFDRKSKKYDHFRMRRGKSNTINHNDVFSICEDNAGKLWFGTYGGGVNLYDPVKKQFTHLTRNNSNLSSDIITSIISLQSGDILIGALKGEVDLINFKELDQKYPRAVPFPLEESKENSLFWISRKVVFEDASGEIWIATNLDGVYRYNPESKKTVHYIHDEENSVTIPSNHITAIYEDQMGIIWLGSTKGLIRFNKKSNEFHLYTMKDGLPDHSVVGVISDNVGDIWVLTRNWISRFDSKTEKVRSFKIQQRVTNELFTHNPLWRTREGEIFVGTQSEGFFSFFPDSIHDLSYLPPVAITDLKISGESVSISEDIGSPILTESINSVREIELKHDQNNLTFEFTALSYLFQERNQYACLLEGAQQDWQYMDGKRRLVNYFNVPPGEYVFKVKASNCDGVWNEQAKSIRIKVLPPWWKTGLAYFLYIVVIILLLIVLYIYTYKWIALKNRLVFEQVEKEKIKELNQIKLRFFTNISHEFRTPLTLILGPLERLLSKGGGDSSTEKQYVLMHRNASRMLRLINQLMDFRKVENKQMELHAEELDIVEFVGEVTQSFEELANEKQIVFELRSASDTLMVWFDRDKLDKILFNLLSNAFKFTSNGGKISVTITASELSGKDDRFVNGSVEIRVTDNGRGMSAGQVERIFDRFYQGEHDQTGTGIGLSLTRNLVEMHRGVIFVTSEKGKGSCFIIKLPLGKEHLEEKEVSPRPKGKEFVASKRIQDMIPAKTTEEGDQLNAKEVASAQAPLILIVEDNDSLRSFIRENLEHEYRIMEAENGKQAYEKALETIPDLIISDVMMPEMDGLELCRTVKTDSRISHVPVILLTALDTVKDQLTGYKLGADDYISKPFNPGLLEVRVKNLIQTRMELKKRFRKEINLEPKDITIASADEKLLEKALKLIEENLSDPDFTVEKLGQEIGISRVHLYRKIKALTDQTATEFIRTIRLKQAAKLLLQKKLTVAEISFLVGFKNPVSFGRSFKSHFGITPSEYANSNSKDITNTD